VCCENVFAELRFVVRADESREGGSRRFVAREAARGARWLKSALQLQSKRNRIRFAHVHERVSTESFVVWIIGSSRVEPLMRTRRL